MLNKYKMYMFGLELNERQLNFPTNASNNVIHHKYWIKNEETNNNNNKIWLKTSKTRYRAADEKKNEFHEKNQPSNKHSATFQIHVVNQFGLSRLYKQKLRHQYAQLFQIFYTAEWCNASFNDFSLVFHRVTESKHTNTSMHDLRM